MGSMCIFQLREVAIGYLRTDVESNLEQLS